MAAVIKSVEAPRPRRRAGGSHAGFAVALLAIVAGWVLPIDRYIVPQHGIGYALGIVGGAMMLCLLIYPIRKRKSSLAYLGSVRGWFKAHMVLGVIGPIAILYHSNFRLGATNSNMALISMLIVAGSGLVGRYLYSRIHHGLYGQRATLKELAADAERLRGHSGDLRLLPGLMDQIKNVERRIGAPSIMVVQPFVAAWRYHREIRRLRRLIRDAVRISATRSRVVGWQQDRLTLAVEKYVAARLLAARRIAEFEASEKLFAAWHVFHLPMFTMLIVVGIVHVVAVHLY